MKIRTRYAPSPTGFFHVGGARTALYNYLYAKHNGGDFIVRIEDTDAERNVENGTESQLENIAWLGISPDESPLSPGAYGPYKQTEKLARYEQLAEKLIDEGKAYYCFCTKEKLDQERMAAELHHQTPKYNRHCLGLSKQEVDKRLRAKEPHVVRLKIDENLSYAWNDLIRGEISIPGNAMTDPVILKSNKVAMYNFAVVVDDYDMDITHVLRAEEHISNTPYQLAIKKALGFDDKEINYGHLSIVVNDQGKKLSKRDLTLKQFISDYKTMGYLPSAIINFLALLGWCPKDNNEVMDLKALIEKFDITDVNKSPATFDLVKMNWTGNQHFKLLDDVNYLSFVKPFVNSTNPVYAKHGDEVLLLFKSQISYAQQIDELIEEYFGNSKNLSAEAKTDIKECKANYEKILSVLTPLLDTQNLTSEADYKELINAVKQQTGLKGKDLFMTIRILSTIKTHGPELAKTLYLLGKEKIISNLQFIRKEL